MNFIRKIEVFGDSILKGIQVSRKDKRYVVDNNIDVELLGRKFSLEINNRSRFGCTVTKCAALIDRFLQGSPDCRAVVMDLGGNDCDFAWDKISASPDAEHEPKTPVALFEETYRAVIAKLRARGITPILTTLPPIDPQRYFEWFSRGLNAENILRWLGDITSIYRFQEMYSRAAERIARITSAPLVDLRGAFLRHRRIENLLCEDGVHPSTEGQAVITSAFVKFAEEYNFPAIN